MVKIIVTTTFRVDHGPFLHILMDIMWHASQSHFLFFYIHCHSCVMFAINSMNICNDQVNYDKIIIQ